MQKSGVEQHHGAGGDDHVHHLVRMPWRTRQEAQRLTQPTQVAKRYRWPPLAWSGPFTLSVQSMARTMLKVSGVRARHHLQTAILLIGIFQVDATRDDLRRSSAKVMTVLVPIYGDSSTPALLKQKTCLPATWGRTLSQRRPHVRERPGQGIRRAHLEKSISDAKDA